MAGVTAAGKRIRGSSRIAVEFGKRGLLSICSRQTGKKLLWVLDGSPIHRWERSASIWRRKARTNHLEALPGYAPDLSRWIKVVGTIEGRRDGNLSCMDMEECIWNFPCCTAAAETALDSIVLRRRRIAL